MRIILLIAFFLLSCGGQDKVKVYYGLDGVDGFDGTNGANGAHGSNGVDGANGVDGTQGAVGETGAIGLPGTIGESGAQGPEGKMGALRKQTLCIYRLKYGWATVHVTVETFVFHYMWTRLKYYPGACKK